MARKIPSGERAKTPRERQREARMRQKDREWDAIADPIRPWRYQAR